MREQCKRQRCTNQIYCREVCSKHYRAEGMSPGHTADEEARLYEEAMRLWTLVMV